MTSAPLPSGVCVGEGGGEEGREWRGGREGGREWIWREGRGEEGGERKGKERGNREEAIKLLHPTTHTQLYKLFIVL